jgi:hypothetical protein
VGVLALFWAASVAVGTVPARAGDACTTSQAADALLRCAHCKAMKKLLTEAAIADVAIEVHDLEHGVVVELEGKSPDGVALVHQLVDEMWTSGKHCETEISTACHERFEALGHVGIDRAVTEKGVILVLSSEDDELVRWVREDARVTRSFVLSAASTD